MGPTSYLVSFGHSGAIGCFQADPRLACRRGDRVVIRTEHGVNSGTVLCPATPRLIRSIDRPVFGQLLRRMTPEDEAIARAVQARAEALFEDARRLAAELELPLEILDVEIQLDGHRVTLYYLRGAECDERTLVSTLSKKNEVMVALRDVGLPEGATACGRPDCGNGQGGAGCTTCTTGGCATGCGSRTVAKEVQEYFAGLREKMEQAQRISLL